MGTPLHLALLLAALSAGPGESSKQAWVVENGVRRTDWEPPPPPDHFFGLSELFDPHGLYLGLGGIVGSSQTFGEGAVHGVHGGGEISLTYEWFPWGLGGYVDAIYASGTERTRVSAGLQALWAMFGVDVGYVASLGTDGPAHGVQYSGFLTFGFLGAQFRHCVLLDAPDEFEGSFFVKIPLEIYGKFLGGGLWFAGWH